jgi:hypothetical protein
MLGNKETKLGAQIVAWGAPTYERPDEWIALPELSVGDERLVGLMRVNDATNNHVAILCAGDYTVDWGDGYVENFASGARGAYVPGLAAGAKMAAGVQAGAEIGQAAEE